MKLAGINFITTKTMNIDESINRMLNNGCTTTYCNPKQHKDSDLKSQKWRLGDKELSFDMIEHAIKSEYKYPYDPETGKKKEPVKLVGTEVILTIKDGKKEIKFTQPQFEDLKNILENTKYIYNQ